MNESDLRSDVHYLGSSENKAWKKKIKACTGFVAVFVVVYFKCYQIMQHDCSIKQSN